jgi:hypothetical protein
MHPTILPSRYAPAKSVQSSYLTLGPLACAQSRAKKQPRGGEHAGEKRRGGAEKRKKLRATVLHGKQEMPMARARASRMKNKVILPLVPFGLWVPCKARWVWAGAVIFASATFQLQFAKASAATLQQQEKNNSADVERGRANISGFILAVMYLRRVLVDVRRACGRGTLKPVGWKSIVYAQKTRPLYIRQDHAAGGGSGRRGRGSGRQGAKNRSILSTPPRGARFFQQNCNISVGSAIPVSWVGARHQSSPQPSFVRRRSDFRWPLPVV